MKLLITLAALTRVEYAEILDVPDDLTEDQLDDLVEERYMDVDGAEYKDDPYFWEKGHCSWEALDEPTESADYKVTVQDDDTFVVEPVPSKPFKNET